MLQEPATTHAESENGSTQHVVHALMQFLLAVRYRRNVVFAVLIVAGLAGGLYYLTATPYYRSSAAILVMGSTDANGLPPSVVADAGRQHTLMATLEELFSRDQVIKKAVDDLQRDHPELIDMAGVDKDAWAEVIRENLSAAVVRGTRIIELSYRSKDPEDAVTVVEAVVGSYIAFLDQTHRGSAGEFKDLLTREKDELESKLFRQQQELIVMQQRTGDMGIPPGSTLVHPPVQRAFAFHKSLIETQQQRIDLETSLSTIQAAVRNRQDLQQHIMTVADVLGKEILMRSLGFNEYESYSKSYWERQLIEDIADLNSMEKDYGPAHPDVAAKKERIRMTREYLAGYEQRIIDRTKKLQRTKLAAMLVNMVQQKLHETRQREASLLAAYNRAHDEAVELNGEMTQLKMLKDGLAYSMTLKEALVEKISKIKLKEDGQELRTPRIQNPKVADKPFAPDLRCVMMMALAGGLAVALTLVYVLDTLDDRFRCVEEIQGHLGVPVLSMVRQLDVGDTYGADALQVHVAPNSSESEAFRTLRTALALADKEARQIVISSAEPGDGKTTVLANLAVSYAQADKRTLLIDADLRRPGLTAIMGMRGVDGLSGVIRGQGSVVEMAAGHIRPSGIEGLDILPSGPRPANPAELLANPRFSELLAWAETVYDQILIDSPPALATSDTAVIGRLVDGAVVVVQPDKNRRRMVVRAAESLASLKIPLLGVIINRVGADSDRGYYGYGSGYGYGYEPAYAAGEDDVDEVPEDIVPKRVA